MKYFVAAAMFFLMAGTSHADSFVSVVMNPVTFDLSVNKVDAPETVSATFLWDTTTNVLSDFTLSTNGPFTGFPPTPTVSFSNGGIDPQGQFTQFGIESLMWNNGTVSFQLNYANHGNLVPLLGSAPGMYLTDMEFLCSSSCTGSGELFVTGTATVSAVGAPEPSSLLLVGAGFVSLLTILTTPGLKRRFRLRACVQS